MDEFSVPPNYVPSLQDNLTDDVFGHAEHWPDQAGFSRRVGQRWVPVTNREAADQVTELAAGLIASGVQVGERVALFSHTRFEWMLCDFAIWTAGAVTVPVYETSSAEQVEWIFTDSGAVAAFVETEDHAKLVAQRPVSQPELRDVWVFDSGGIDRLVAAGRGVSVTVWTETPRCHWRLAGDHHLHLRYHRTTQGLRDHARQPPGRGAQRLHRREHPGGGLQRRHEDVAVPAARAHSGAVHPARGGAQPGSPRAHRRP